MAIFCPYCNSVQSILLGNVFCSNSQHNMQNLDTGTLSIKSKKLEETDWHITRLSVRCMLNGNQKYIAGSKDYKVHPNNFLLANQGQRYKTWFENDQELEMLMVGFKPGFAEQVYTSLTKSDEWLIDNIDHSRNEQLIFYENTYPKDQQVESIFAELHKLIQLKKNTANAQHKLDVLYSLLMEHLLSLNFKVNINTQFTSIKKNSTKQEIYKRLQRSRDYIDSHYKNPITIDEMAKAACFSPHHFKRLFKQVYRINPHEYLTHIRLNKANSLLQLNTDTVKAIGSQIGFENDASFIRMYRQKFGITPMQMRLKTLNSH